jgi:translation initiation factor 1A
MPKNTKGGKKHKRGKNLTTDKRELIFKEDGMEYGQAVKMLGSGHVEVFCFDGVTRLGKIRGKMRKRVWIAVGDMVLVGLREFEHDRCDVMYKYNSDEARNLKAYGEIPTDVVVNENEFDEESDVEIVFGDSDDGAPSE